MVSLYRGLEEIFDAGAGFVTEAARVDIFLQVVVKPLRGSVKEFGLFKISDARFAGDEVQFHHNLLAQGQPAVQ